MPGNKIIILNCSTPQTNLSRIGRRTTPVIPGIGAWLLDHFSPCISTMGGIVRPSALAVLRLVANSNFVGCSTGMSAGLDLGMEPGEWGLALLSKQSLKSHESTGRALTSGMTTTHQDIETNVGVSDASGSEASPSQDESWQPTTGRREIDAITLRGGAAGEKKTLAAIGPDSQVGP